MGKNSAKYLNENESFLPIGMPIQVQHKRQVSCYLRYIHYIINFKYTSRTLGRQVERT